LIWPSGREKLNSRKKSNRQTNGRQIDLQINSEHLVSRPSLRTLKLLGLVAPPMSEAKWQPDPGRRMVATARGPPQKQDSVRAKVVRPRPVSDETSPIPDAWWASLAHRLLHPVQVEVIKTLRQSDRPLSAREIAELVESTSAAHLARQHLRRLRKVGAIDYAYGETPSNAIDIRYRLVLELPADDR
jgi:hypothetical protein